MYYIHIPQSEVEKWLYRFGNKVKDIFEKWKATGRIKATKEAGRYTVRSSWLNKRRVMMFIFEEPKVEDDEQEEPKNSSSNISKQTPAVKTETLDLNFDDDEDIDALFEDDTTSQAQASQEEIIIEIDEDGADEN